jgi:hypothetical protein
MVYGMEENILKLYEDGYLKINLDPDTVARLVKYANQMRREKGTGPDNLTVKNVGPRPEKRLGIDRIAEFKKYMAEYNTQDYKDFLKDNRVSKVDRDWLVNLHMHEKPNPFKDFMKKFIGNKTVKSKRPVMFKRKSRALRTKTLVSRRSKDVKAPEPKEVKEVKEVKAPEPPKARDTRARDTRTRTRGRTHRTHAPPQAVAAALVPVAPAPAPARPNETFIKFHSPGQGESPTTANLRSAYHRKTAEADPTIRSLRSKIHADGKFSPQTERELAARTATVLATDANSRGLNTALRSRAASKSAAVLRTERTALATPGAQAGLSPVTRGLIANTTVPGNSPTGR